MKKTYAFTMRTIAAALAALSMMSAVSTAVMAADEDILCVEETLIAENGGDEETEEEADEAVPTVNTVTEKTASGSLPAEEILTDEDDTGIYTITFDTDGGNFIAPITAQAGTALTAPDDPVKEGFYFLSWSRSVPKTMPKENMTIRALWVDTPIYESCKADGVKDELSLKMVPVSYAFAQAAPADSGITEDDLKEFGRDAGIATADGAFDFLGDVIPGGKIITAPFKVLLHRGVDAPDPMAAMNEKLDNVDNKLDNVTAKLDDLSDHMDSSTQWLGREIKNITDMSRVQDAFRNLAPYARDLSRDIQSIEENPEYLNNYEKTFEIAALGTQEDYKAVSRCVYTLQKHMHGGNYAYSNLFVAAYNCAASKRMVSREAYNDAKEILGGLMTEYVGAVALMEEVEVAQRAVERFSETELSQLSPDVRASYESYKKHSMNRMTKNYNDTVNALIACGSGYKAFEKTYDNPDFINKGACRKALDAKVRTYCFWIEDISGDIRYAPKTYDGDKVSPSEINNSASRLTKAEINALVEYIRTEYPGMSVMDFFHKVGAWVQDEADFDFDSAYLITDDTLDLSRQEQKTEYEGIFDCIKHEYKNDTFTLKGAVDVMDTAASEKDMTIAACDEYRLYEMGFYTDGEYYNFQNPYITVFVIS